MRYYSVVRWSVNQREDQLPEDIGDSLPMTVARTTDGAARTDGVERQQERDDHRHRPARQERPRQPVEQTDDDHDVEALDCRPNEMWGLELTVRYRPLLSACEI